MTIFDLLKSPQFPQKPILEKLVSQVTSLTKTELFSRSDQEITDHQYNQIQEMYSRYVDNKEPLEYILGYVTFAKLQFSVSPSTIIPRPETEYMIEAVREFFAVQDRSSILLDVGTWSGILWVATVYYESAHIQEAYLCDLSTDALVIAKQNKETLLDPDQQAKTHLVHCSLLDHPTYKEIFQKQQPIVLVANLPYIPDEMFANNADERITKREPTMAFVGWDDGLHLYREMFDQVIAYSTAETTVTMFLEMMTRQIELLAKEYIDHFTFAEVKTFHANIRILKVMKK
jgi:release factor glutamine methyltransferase